MNLALKINSGKPGSATLNTRTGKYVYNYCLVISYYFIFLEECFVISWLTAVIWQSKFCNQQSVARSIRYLVTCFCELHFIKFAT